MGSPIKYIFPEGLGSCALRYLVWQGWAWNFVAARFLGQLADPVQMLIGLTCIVQKTDGHEDRDTSHDKNGIRQNRLNV